MVFCQTKCILKNNRFKINHCVRHLSQEKKQSHFISSADPVSNLHHIKYAISENETELERKLRINREELQRWNEIFWTRHNTNFLAEKRSFENAEKLKKKNNQDQVLSADEMSEFYKKFLDSHWKVHLNYLLEWYKKLFYVTFLHFKVSLQNLFRTKFFR